MNAVLQIVEREEAEELGPAIAPEEAEALEQECRRSRRYSAALLAGAIRLVNARRVIEHRRELDARQLCEILQLGRGAYYRTMAGAGSLARLHAEALIAALEREASK